MQAWLAVLCSTSTFAIHELDQSVTSFPFTCFPAVQARLAVLYSTGTFAIYELDQSNELRATAITPALVSARLGRVADVEWMPVPPPVGELCIQSCIQSCTVMHIIQ